MLTPRLSESRGHADHGWLNARHTFSFADYYDPAWMGFRSLRVINDDIIAPGMGFGTHPHRDMEIITFLISGLLEHKDSMGNGRVIRPGEVQYMSAGSGVRHSEFNHAPDQETHFLQIWILPNQRGIAPGYEQKTISPASKRGALVLVASPQPQPQAVALHADAHMYAGLFDGAEEAHLPLQAQRKAYVFLVRGSLQVNQQPLSAGDALMVSDETQLHFAQGQDAEVLVFDLSP